MKKRLEAWANEYHDGVDLCERLLDAEREAKNFGGALRVAIRLVECGPDEVPMPTGSCDKVFTRAEVLAFGERVREACAASMLENPKAMFRAVRAVDVVRLLDKEKNNE